MRLGVVLGAGGLTGTAFHAGVLAALLDQTGIDAREADVIVGTSAGSTAAALLRQGLSPTDYLNRVTGRPLSPAGHTVLGGLPPLTDPQRGRPSTRRPVAPHLLRAAARRPWAYRPGVVGAALLPAGTRQVDPGASRLRHLFQRWPDRPLWICAVDLSTGRRVVFGRDAWPPVADAVSASCAVPGYYQPVMLDGHTYVDGGAYSLVSADLVADLGLDVVVVSAPLSTADRLGSDRGLLLRLPTRAQLDREVGRLRRAGTRVVVLHPDARLRRLMGSNSMAVGKRAPVARAAYEYAATALRDVGRHG
jgi:NTE family protein